jgi:DUF438 domain-containing protein
MTVVIYLIGRPGTGKYTISQELSKSEFIICDNQLINNPIFTLLNYNGFAKIPEFAWVAIEKIRKIILNFLSEKHDGNYILTNALAEKRYDHKIYNQVKRMAKKRGSLFVPIKLAISQEENVKRITEPSRRLRWKSIDPQDAHSRGSLIMIKHSNLLELDVNDLSAVEAAQKILDHIRNIQK